jgi:hypothetical protein
MQRKKKAKNIEWTNNYIRREGDKDTNRKE